MTSQITAADRFPVRSVQVFGGTMDEALRLIQARARQRRPYLVHLMNSRWVSLLAHDEEFRRAAAAADLVLPDGAPIAWIGRLSRPGSHTVALRGPDVMTGLLRAGLDWDATHFFIGGGHDTHEDLRRALLAGFPGLRIAGMADPWADDVGAEPMRAAARAARASRADYVWVGLGQPKQELFMARYRDLVDAPMLGVGAAFDMLAGRVVSAPGWMQGHGLEWAFRLATHPRRLAHRYLVESPPVVRDLAAAGRQRLRRGARR